ncbi:hypothetical protein CR513_29414, partial [Mucuna pruriens]
MASNTQQFGIRGPNQPRMVNEIGAASNQRLENQLTELTSLVRQLAVGQHQPAMAAKVCGICTSVEHPTDMCPTLQETESEYQPENVGAIGGFQYGKQPYQNRAFDNQQHGRQPFRPGPNQGPYATQQFGSAPNTYQRQAVQLKKMLEHYDVQHKVVFPYHPQTNKQVEVFNREIKRILEKIVAFSRKDWANKLDDTCRPIEPLLKHH